MTTAIDRAQLVELILKQYEARRPDSEAGPHFEPATAYTDPGRFAKEVELIFVKAPVLVALSGELAQPSSYKMLELAGVPLVLLRSTDGVLRGFRNACSHRGAPLLTEPAGCGIRRLSCPCHGWSYDLSGRLVGVPLRRAFPDLDLSRSGLTPVQVYERCGMVFVVIENHEPCDIDGFLGEIAVQFDSLNTSTFVASDPDSLTLQTNWKLAVDTFGENYHFPYVHGDTLMPIVKGNTMATDYYGPHLREVFGLNNIDEISDDRARWASAVFGQHLYPIWIIFPNAAIAAADGAMQLFVTYPGPTVGQCEVVHMKAFDPVLPDELQSAYEFFFDHNWRNVVQVQDFPIAKNIYRSLVVGGRPTMTFGTIDGPLHHLHKHYDKCLSEAH